MKITHGYSGVFAALGSAFLFGAGTPLAKLLLEHVSPWMLAGLLYLGSGLGLAIYRMSRRLQTPRLNPGEARWLVAAVLCGGGIAPVLLMLGLAGMPASHASLLLNAEAVLTTLLAWAVFRENLGRRIALGMLAIVAGALVLGWPQQGTAQAAAQDVSMTSLWPALAVVLACLFWALDNNFTRKVSLSDASWIACIKGLAAGTTNLALAFALGATLPAPGRLAAAMLVGFLAYGVSLALFVVALRHLGASRTGAYFSAAPFVGALFSIVFFAEPVSWQLALASALMAGGIWLHLTEHHAHAHLHEVLAHAHLHTHGGDDDDGHHTHQHDPVLTGSHTHAHRHESQKHSHPHYPDAHHQHEH